MRGLCQRVVAYVDASMIAGSSTTRRSITPRPTEPLKIPGRSVDEAEVAKGVEVVRIVCRRCHAKPEHAAIAVG
jgi:cytochrome c5